MSRRNKAMRDGRVKKDPGRGIATGMITTVMLVLSTDSQMLQKGHVSVDLPDSGGISGFCWNNMAHIVPSVHFLKQSGTGYPPISEGLSNGAPSTSRGLS